MSSRRTPEHQQAVEDVRRSNAARPHRNRKKYTRKIKNGKQEEQQNGN